MGWPTTLLKMTSHERGRSYRLLRSPGNRELTNIINSNVIRKPIVCTEGSTVEGLPYKLYNIPRQGLVVRGWERKRVTANCVRGNWRVGRPDKDKQGDSDREKEEEKPRSMQTLCVERREGVGCSRVRWILGGGGGGRETEVRQMKGGEAY